MTPDEENDSGWEDLLIEIERALDDGRYSWASDTLEGIHAWVKESSFCTEGQKNAVRNIVGSVH